MKKLMLLGLLLTSALFVNAQKTDTTTLKNGLKGNNELKLNLAYTIAGFPEINYERILKDDMSVGLAVLVGIGREAEYRFAITPNYRVYFGGKRANGFFIEGNAAVVSSNYYDRFYAYDPYTNIYHSYSKRGQTSFGLGAAAGAKFLTKNGLVGEIYLGAGRLFGANSEDAYIRSGVTIGKRF